MPQENEPPDVGGSHRSLSSVEQLMDLATLLGLHSDFDELVRLATTKGQDLVHADALSFVMLNPQTLHTQKTIAQVGTSPGDKHLHILHSSVVGWSLRNGAPLLSADITRDGRFQKTVFGETAARSVMCVPMMLGGSAIGHVVAWTKTVGAGYTSADLALLEHFAAICAPYLGNARALERHFAAPIPDDTLITAYTPLGLIGRSKEFRVLLKAIRAASQCDVRVFIEGESGTGKEVIAHAIHSSSNRTSQRFVAVDCGAIPPQLIESELFGHIKGAFTGATTTRRGLFEEADGGTLFLDEITSLSFDMQAKLLRALQENEVRAVGSNLPKKIDIRIVAATSANTWNLVEQKQFREDLYYRLHVFPILVPTLNARSEDIPLLALHFVKHFATEQRKSIDSVAPGLLQFMRHRKWRGNIRELENFVERIVTLASPGTTSIDHTILPPEIAKEYKASIVSPSTTETRPLGEMLAEVEQQRIREALERYHWNQSEAARELGISERAIRYKMERLGIVKLDNSCRP